MADDPLLRSCGRAGCCWPAAASLSFRYDTRQVWLQDLSAEPDPALYDLCPHHADALTVPRGWERVDERHAGAVVAEPAGRDLDPADGGRPPGAAGYGRNRYAALTAALPRLARELHGRAPGEGRAGAATPSLEAGPQAVPSRELAPMPAGGLPSVTDSDGHGADAAEGRGGQLSIPEVEAGPADAVVVPLDAGARRRS